MNSCCVVKSYMYKNISGKLSQTSVFRNIRDSSTSHIFGSLRINARITMD